jgi:hypothetical protein
MKKKSNNSINIKYNLNRHKFNNRLDDEMLIEDLGKPSETGKKASKYSTGPTGQDHGMEHLEYLKEKNTQARKRLLDLQKRLLEIKSKDNSLYHFNDLKLPQALDHTKETGVNNIIQKYSSANLMANQKTRFQ